MLAERIVQTTKALLVEDDLCVRDPGGLGARVYVPVHVQGKAVDDVANTDRTGAAGCIVTGVDAPGNQVRPGQMCRVGVMVELIVRDDDEEVDVTPVVRVSAAEGSDESCGADRRVSFETFDRPLEPRLADRTESWRCGNLRVGTHRCESPTWRRTARTSVPHSVTRFLPPVTRPKARKRCLTRH